MVLTVTNSCFTCNNIKYTPTSILLDLLAQLCMLHSPSPHLFVRAAPTALHLHHPHFHFLHDLLSHAGQACLQGCMSEALQCDARPSPHWLRCLHSLFLCRLELPIHYPCHLQHDLQHKCSPQDFGGACSTDWGTLALIALATASVRCVSPAIRLAPLHLLSVYTP